MLADNPAALDLPPVILLHHLYSRGPADLQLPLTVSGFTYILVTIPCVIKGDNLTFVSICPIPPSSDLKF